MNTTPWQEPTNPALDGAREEVKRLTKELAQLFCERQNAMIDVAKAKEAGLPIFLPQREWELLNEFRAFATEKGVDPRLMDMVLSVLMSAGKFAQKDFLGRATVLDTQPLDAAILRANLLELTDVIASEYALYDSEAEGTHVERVREREILTSLAQRIPGGTALNLGCADGGLVLDSIGAHFDYTIGYDISPAMISVAKERHPRHAFQVHDLDLGIPVADRSADLAVANFGAASEFCPDLWSEVSRVLRQYGYAYLSFYNRNALVTKWWTPWTTAFKVVLNPHNDTIMVPWHDSEGKPKIFWIHGKAVSDEEVRKAAGENRLDVISMESSSPLWDDKPREFFRHKEAVEAARLYDLAHASVPPFTGQYLRVVVQKI